MGGSGVQNPFFDPIPRGDLMNIADSQAGILLDGSYQFDGILTQIAVLYENPSNDSRSDQTESDQGNRDLRS